MVWAGMGIGLTLVNFLVYQLIVLPKVMSGKASDMWEGIVANYEGNAAKASFIGLFKGQVLCAIIWPTYLIGLAVVIATAKGKE
jgi:hypothetical protein